MSGGGGQSAGAKPENDWDGISSIVSLKPDVSVATEPGKLKNIKLDLQRFTLQTFILQIGLFLSDYRWWFVYLLYPAA